MELYKKEDQNQKLEDLFWDTFSQLLTIVLIWKNLIWIIPIFQKNQLII